MILYQKLNCHTTLMQQAISNFGPNFFATPLNLTVGFNFSTLFWLLSFFRLRKVQPLLKILQPKIVLVILSYFSWYSYIFLMLHKILFISLISHSPLFSFFPALCSYLRIWGNKPDLQMLIHSLSFTILKMHRYVYQAWRTVQN